MLSLVGLASRRQARFAYEKSAGAGVAAEPGWPAQRDKIFRTNVPLRRCGQLGAPESDKIWRANVRNRR